MKRSIFYKWPLNIRAKLLVLVIGATCLPVLALASFYYSFSVHSLLQQAENRELTQVKVLCDRIHSLITSTKHDLLFLAGMPALEPFVAEPMISPAKRAELRAIFLAFAQTHAQFDQVRYIDADGMEVVRINQNEGNPGIVSDQRLQNKALRYYFRETMRLRPGQIYVSPIDLNVEWGHVEEPRKPMIRLATPLFSPTGDPRGMVVVNFLGEQFLEQLERVKLGNERRVIITDDRGKLMAEGWADGEEALAFVFEEGRMLQDELPSDMVGTMLQRNFGILAAPVDMLIAHATITPSADLPDRYWKVFTSLPRSTAMRAVSSFTSIFLAILGVVLILAVFIGALAARHFLRPIGDLKAGTRALARGEYDVEIQILTNDEIEELANDFLTMTRQLKAKDEKIQCYNHELEETVARRSKEIIEEKQKLDSIVESLGAALALIDGDFIIRWHNNTLEEWCGAPLMGRHCCEVYNLGQDACEDCALQAVFATGRGVSREADLRSCDGLRECLETVRPIFDEDGGIKYLLKLSQDISEKKELERKEAELERQLLQAERLSLLGEFSAGIAHEIGNPLGSMKLNAQILVRKMNGRAAERVAVQRIIDQIDRLDGIVKTFSAFARPKEVHPIAYRVEDLLSEVLALTMVSLKRHEVELAQDIQLGIPKVYVDVSQIQQVVLNLILNAIQAMPQGGTLSVSSSCQRPEYVQLSIADTGPGIPREEREKVFDPFFTTKSNGTGLGLSIAYNLVKHNCGKLSLGSPERGAEFVLALPTIRRMAK